MKRPYKIKFIPYQTIWNMSFQELKDNGFIKKTALTNHAEILLRRLHYTKLENLGLIKKSRVSYNMIKEHIMDYINEGTPLKEAIYLVSKMFHISPKSINHILYRGNK